MKILTVTIDHFPQSGGLARYADGVCRLFGQDMRVIADIDADEERKVSYQNDAPYKLEFEPFMRSGWPKWWESKQLMKEASEDVIFVHHVLPLGFAAMLSGKPYVVFLHGKDFATASSHWRRKHLLRRVLKNAISVVVNSEILKNEVNEFAGTESICCYPQPWMVGSPEFRVPRSDKFRIVSVSRLEERKGFHRVLEMLRDDPDMLSRCSYTIVGKGGYAEDLKKLVEDYRLQDSVKIVETDSTDAIRDGYANADLFVLPILNDGQDKEGFGIVYLEAATFGVPSVAMDIPGVNEAVLHEQTGLLANDAEELRDFVKRLMSDEKELRTLGEAARQRIEDEFNPEEIFMPLKHKLGYD
jgi:phosphatidyl-myo-inositol dimannoside synthase